MNEQQRRQAQPVWQAYNAMETTKQRHFDFLTELERRQKQLMLPATDQEKTLLEKLLRDHDEQVILFQRASLTLRDQFPDTHVALFNYIGEINEKLRNYKTPDA